MIILVLFTVGQLILMAALRSSTAQLLEVNDVMEIYSDGILAAQFQLWPFPFIEQFTQNISVEGSFCYAETIADFVELCHLKSNDRTMPWVVVTPFDYINTNEMLNQILKYNIQGLIISSETQIDSGGYYSMPKIISLIAKNKLDTMMQFAAPFRNDTTVKVVHDYITNCGTLNNVKSYLFLLSGGYLVLIISWIISIWYLHKDQINTLQKSLLIIPTFKLLRVFIYGLYLGQCPWEDQLTGRYLMMALVTVSTIYQTVYVAIFLLISKGWIIIRGSLSRQQATHITMLMGTVYLTYSAYYVSANVNGIKNLIGIVINVIYIILFVIILTNSLSVLNILKMHLYIIENNDVQSLVTTIKLKISMVRKFIKIAAMFFLFEIIVNGILPFLNQLEQFNSFLTIASQLYDFIVIVMLMWVFRPRTWPEYFNLGILEIPLLGLGGLQSYMQDEERRVIAPINYAKVCYEQSFSKSNLSLITNENVIIYNPMFDSSHEQLRDNAGANMSSLCEYTTLRDDDNNQRQESNKQSQASNNEETIQRKLNRMLRSLQIGIKESLMPKPKSE